MSLAAHQNDMLWQQHIHGLLEAGIPERMARSMIGKARKDGRSYREIEQAICRLKQKPPPDMSMAWGFWNRAFVLRRENGPPRP